MKRIFSILIISLVLLSTKIYSEINSEDSIPETYLKTFINNSQPSLFIPFSIENKDDDKLKPRISYTLNLKKNIFGVDNLNIITGYMTNKTVLFGIDYEIGNLDCLKDKAVLDKINFSIGVVGTYDFENSNKGVGINFKLVKINF